MKLKSINYLWNNNISINLNELTPEQIINLCRESVKQHGYFKFRQGENKGVCDVQSANVFIKVFDALDSERQEVFKQKLNLYGFSYLVNKCWGLVE